MSSCKMECAGARGCHTIAAHSGMARTLHCRDNSHKRPCVLLPSFNEATLCPIIVLQEHMHARGLSGASAACSQACITLHRRAPHQEHCLAAGVLAQEAGVLQGEHTEVLPSPAQRLRVASRHAPQLPLGHLVWRRRAKVYVAQAGGRVHDCRLHLHTEIEPLIQSHSAYL